MAAILVFSVFIVLKVNKNYVVFKDVLIKKKSQLNLKLIKKNIMYCLKACKIKLELKKNKKL